MRVLFLVVAVMLNLLVRFARTHRVHRTFLSLVDVVSRQLRAVATLLLMAACCLDFDHWR